MADLSVVHHEDYEVDIGPHVFPTLKYRLVRDRLIADGTIGQDDLVHPEPATDDDPRHRVGHQDGRQSDAFQEYRGVHDQAAPVEHRRAGGQPVRPTSHQARSPGCVAQREGSDHAQGGEGQEVQKGVRDQTDSERRDGPGLRKDSHVVLKPCRAEQARCESFGGSERRQLHDVLHQEEEDDGGSGHETGFGSDGCALVESHGDARLEGLSPPRPSHFTVHG